MNGAGRRLVVLAASGPSRRSLGPVAWAVLEALALRAVMDGGRPVVAANVRSVAAELGVGKDTAAGALRRLAMAGLIRPLAGRTGGRFANGRYQLDTEACRRAGLAIDDPAGFGCPVAPSPVPRDPEAPGTAGGDMVSAEARGAALARTGGNAPAGPGQGLLFGPAPGAYPSNASVPTLDQPTPGPSPTNSHPPLNPTATSTRTSDSPTTPSEHDALAPGVPTWALSARRGLNGGGARC